MKPKIQQKNAKNKRKNLIKNRFLNLYLKKQKRQN